jgi:RNase P protein component
VRSNGSILTLARLGLRRRTIRTRLRARSLIGQYPGVYLPLARWKRRRHLRHARRWGIPPERMGPVFRDTDAVIEGFPRSANTFAATAFELAQTRPVRVARHLHVPSQIIAGARLGIPTIVLIRDPEEAVLSLSLWTPHVTLEDGFRDYTRFYRRILPYRDRFVVATFEEVSTDFGEVIRRLNERFGSTFREFQHTEANVALCFKIIEEHDRRTMGKVVEKTVARPSQQRERMKNALRSASRSPKLARVRADAHDIYQTITSK